MDTLGQHLLLDVWLEDDLTEKILMRIIGLVRRRFTVVREVRHDFDPQGLTWVLVLSESHFAIHTYPEHRYLSLDLYICNPNVDLNQTARDLLAGLNVSEVQSRVTGRGQSQNIHPRAKASGASKQPGTHGISG